MEGLGVAVIVLRYDCSVEGVAVAKIVLRHGCSIYISLGLITAFAKYIGNYLPVEVKLR